MTSRKPFGILGEAAWGRGWVHPDGDLMRKSFAMLDEQKFLDKHRRDRRHRASSPSSDGTSPTNNDSDDTDSTEAR
jgi:hypothetical protein